MKKQKKSKYYKISPTGIPLFRLFLWVYYKIRVKYWRLRKSYKYDYWCRFEKTINRLSFIALEYGRKNNGSIDKKNIPIIKYQFIDNILKLKIEFKRLLTDNDYEKVLKIIKANTNVVILNYEVDMGICCIEVGRLIDNVPIETYVSSNEIGLIPMGVMFGKVVYWAFKEHPHVLIAGSTGSGKSSFIRYILSSLCRFYKVDVVDGKSVDFASYKGYFSAYGDSLKVGSVYNIIYEFEKEMQARYELLNKLGIKNIYGKGCDLLPRFLLIDEFSRIIESIQDKKEKEKLKACMANLVALGRGAGMHVIASMQRPDAVYMTGDARNNFTVRIALGNNEVETYRMMFNNGELQKEKYKVGQGVLAIDDNLYRIATPFLDDIKLK